jgi:hypothetical protein
LELLIVETVASETACFGVGKMDALAKRQDALMKWEFDGSPTSVLDTWLENMSVSAVATRETRMGSGSELYQSDRG